MTDLARPSSVQNTIAGYVLGSLGALLIFALASLAHPGDGHFGFRHSATAGSWAASLGLGLIVPVLPFLLVRAISGRNGFATATGGIIRGTAIGVLSIPVAVLLLRLAHISEPDQEGLSQELVGAIRFTWPLYAGAGAAGGLIFWSIAYSPLAALAREMVRDTAPLPGTGNMLTRRSAMLLSGLGVSGAAVLIGRRLTDRRSDGEQGRFVLEAEVPMNGHPSLLAWSPDGQTWAALSTIEPWLAICGADGENLREFDVSLAGAQCAPVFTRNGRHLVLAGPANTGRAFAVSAIDAQTAEPVFAIEDPDPGLGGDPAAAVSIAISADGGTLAVAFNALRPGHPVTLFSTGNWEKQSTIDPGGLSRNGIGPISLSGDARILAMPVDGTVNIVDVPAGQVVRTIGVSPLPAGNPVAISPDNKMVAVMGANGVHVHGLADGAQLAFHPVLAPARGDVVWDPQQRFIAFFGRDGIVRFWSPFEAGGRDAQASLRSPAGGVAVSHDGKRIAAGNGTAVSFFRVN